MSEEPKQPLGEAATKPDSNMNDEPKRVFGNKILHCMMVGWVSGFLGGLTMTTVGHPFDTIKVRQQIKPNGSQTFISCAASIMKNEGFGGFFKGLMLPCLTAGAMNGLATLVYNPVYQKLRNTDCDSIASNSVWRKYYPNAIAGAMAGAAFSIPCSPIELVKVKFQAVSESGDNAKKKYGSPVKCLWDIYRTHGIRGVYKGWTMTLFREIPGWTVYMTSFDVISDKMRGDKKEASVPQILIAGGFAGCLSWLGNIPIDIIKSRLQADDINNPRYKGIVHCVKDIYHTDGGRAFFRGLPAICLRAFPANAVFFLVYKKTKYILGETPPVDANRYD